MASLNFPVVGIGASAGGIEAFHGFFKHMPDDCGMAFVVILHLPADRKSMLPEILGRWTQMPVVESSDNMELQANCVYVPPPHSLVTIEDGRFRITLEKSDGAFRPIDTFFDSLGQQQGDKAAGIVLSGTGSDGSLGLKSLKSRGGLTMAQGTDGSAPQYPNMPEGAIASGAVDLVVPVEHMPEQLSRIWSGAKVPLGTGPEDIERLRLEICGILRERVGHDFSGYRGQTFMRRVDRRMQVLDAKSLQDYLLKLRASPDEATFLFRDLLIRVTSFFRDAETFEILKQKVIPLLFANKHADATVRVWAPGCATGEEAYSIAILLREHMDTLSAPPKVQIFATDIDDAAISTARAGKYPPGLLEGLSPERLARFFTPSQGGHVVGKEIRELCTFSIHNLVRDPPFSMMSLVSCRNLLIYMNPELQERIIPVFHYALVPYGVLLLGGAESVVQHEDLFATIDKNARIFQRRVGRSPELSMSWQRSVTMPVARAPGTTFSTLPGVAALIREKVSGNGRSSGKRPIDQITPITRYADLLGAIEPNAANIGQLQFALSTVSEEFGSLAEQYQSALEELRSANEELHSVNEEMQSANEELETSKEELQSLNEELHTVNMRLTEKISELDRSNSDLRNLFESTQIATVFLDRHLIIRSFTPAIASLYNLIPTDEGRPLTDIVTRLRYDRLREDVAAVLKTLEPLERRVERADRAIHYIMRILPYRDPDSTVSGVLITFIDVTSIVQAETALREADVRKDLFLATLSHELRNPLAPVRTAAQLLTSPKLSAAELQRVQAIISRQVAHMGSLLDDLLDVSRITRGAFTLKKSYVPLQDVIDAAIEASKPVMDRRQHTLRVDNDSHDLTLEADPVRMTQVLTNLLTNAAKYTPKGGLIHVGTRADGNSLVLYVRDNGVGLSTDMLTKVFDMFAQVEAQRARAEGGLGIGLALVKGLVELHGGRIEARSEGLDKGSEFLVILPRSMVAEHLDSRSVATEAVATVAKRLLIVDDHSDGADVLKVLLSQAGHEVEVAHTGPEALELARKIRPQVAVLDIGLPGMTGYEVAERIRREAWGHNIKLIAVTGWGNEDDRRKAIAAGFDFHMTKPVDPDALRKLIEDAPRP